MLRTQAGTCLLRAWLWRGIFLRPIGTLLSKCPSCFVVHNFFDIRSMLLEICRLIFSLFRSVTTSVVTMYMSAMFCSNLVLHFQVLHFLVLHFQRPRHETFRIHGSWVMPINSPGGSTLQCGAGRYLLCNGRQCYLISQSPDNIQGGAKTEVTVIAHSCRKPRSICDFLHWAKTNK